MDFLELLRAVATVAAVLGLLAGALYLLRKRGFVLGSSTQNQSLAVIARVALTANHSVHLLKSETGTFLIATHQSGCTLIDARPANPVASAEGPRC